MRVELKIITDLYSDPDEKGRSKILKKNIKTRISLDTDMFEAPTELFNSRGNVIKNRCKIHIRDIGPMILNHSYEEIAKIKNQQYKPILGFGKKLIK